MRKRIEEILITPIKAMRMRYVPLLMIYFAYGASGFSAIAQSFWEKKHLSLSAEDLMVIGVWISLPWTIKMVFGQFADSIPLFRSVRRSYIFVAAGLMALGSLIMAGMAGEWAFITTLAPKGTLYLFSGLIIVMGVVLQDVVADAMSVEVVDREGKTEEEIKKELATVQLLGRLAISIAAFCVAGLGGWLAGVFSYKTIFLLALIIPVISISGSLFVRLEKKDLKPINWKVLGGGLGYACFVAGLGILRVPYAQEIIFAGSMAVVVYLLRSITHELSACAKKSILYAAIVIFAYRCVPAIGPGATWWEIDVLGFDEAFFGTLAQIGAGLAIAGMWFGAKMITERSIRFVFFWLTIIGFVLSLPVIGLYYGLHHWTEAHFGFGARTIMLIDQAIGSPFVQISMIPMLALIAIHAPRGNAATWFALMASLMNLALTAGSLMTKYLNMIWVVRRDVFENGIRVVSADYSQLGHILITTTLIGFVLPLIAILLFMRGDETKKSMRALKDI